MHARREQVAAAGIAWVANESAQGDRFTREQALQAIDHELRKWKVRTGRITEVLSGAATGYVASGAVPASLALRLLLDAGADLQRANALRAARPPRRVERVMPPRAAGRAAPPSAPPRPGHAVDRVAVRRGERLRSSGRNEPA
jgi:hypothetical protein